MSFNVSIVKRPIAEHEVTLEDLTPGIGKIAGLMSEEDCLPFVGISVTIYTDLSSEARRSLVALENISKVKRLEDQSEISRRSDVELAKSIASWNLTHNVTDEETGLTVEREMPISYDTFAGLPEAVGFAVGAAIGQAMIKASKARQVDPNSKGS